MMKVLYINRPDVLTKRGGDTIQMMKTKEYIEKNYDINISICDDPNNTECFIDVDVVHIFNLQTADYTKEALSICQRMKKKSVVSTIFWDLRSASYVNMIYKALQIKPSKNVEKCECFGNIVNWIAYKICNNKSNIMFNKRDVARNILFKADYLLPNSDEELHLLSKIYNIDIDIIAKKSRVVPNAIDSNIAIDCDITGDANKEMKIKDYVIQVGRIEPIKNQISVLKALYNHRDIPILFVGRAGNESYYKELKELSAKRGNVYFISEVKNSDIYAYYKNAKCHVLPSFRESPGLASLEALVCNTPIVVSDGKYCPVNYYKFDEYGYLCNPYSVKSIEDAVLEATSNGMKKKLSKDYGFLYSYEYAAAETVKAYKSLIK